MSKYSMNELKLEIAQILDEAKKHVSKKEKLKERGGSIEAYGIYDEAFDFSPPLGSRNLYAQQGGSNFGPYTASGARVDSSFNDPNTGSRMKEHEEHALRLVVREVIENGLVPANSAWAPMMTKQRQMFESAWDAADHIFEAWYDRQKKSEAAPKKKKSDTDYGPVKKHGFEKKNKR